VSKTETDNARLIAELLAALEALVFDIEISCERWGDSSAGPASVSIEGAPLPVSEESWQAARAAIAKARGHD
jgi:hypothetical protein